MPVLPAPPAPTHELGGTRFTSLATPSRGSTETSIWQVEIAPASPVVPHVLTREVIFVVLDGTATATIDGVTAEARSGDVVVVPPGALFALANAGDRTLRLLCCLPVGGQARTEDGATFTPPWAA